MPSRARNAAAIDAEEAAGLLLWGVGVMGVVLCWQVRDGRGAVLAGV